MASMAVLNIQPVKRGKLVGIQRHDCRLWKNNVPENIHKDNSIFNQFLIGHDVKYDLERAIEGLQMQRKQKDPAQDNIAAEVVLSASPAFFGLDDDGREKMSVEDNLRLLEDASFQAWLSKSTAWLRTRNCCFAVLHMDEKTPHIHGILPAVAQNDSKRTKKGRLVINYNKLFGQTREEHLLSRIKDPEKRKIKEEELGVKYRPEETLLGKLQTSYAEAVKDLGLQRGSTSDYLQIHMTPRQWRGKKQREKEEHEARVKMQAEIASARQVQLAQVNAEVEARRRSNLELDTELAREREALERDRLAVMEQQRELQAARTSLAEQRIQVERETSELIEQARDLGIITKAVRTVHDVFSRIRDWVNAFSDHALYSKDRAFSENARMLKDSIRRCEDRTTMEAGK